MADDTTTGTSAKPRTRSPSYPSIGLEEAIRRAGVLHESIHDHAVAPEAIAEMWNSNTKSSAFLQGAATLKQFGLLEDDGKGQKRQVKLTELAKDILVHDEDSPERAEFVKRAALQPKIHLELWTKYGGNLPQSDSPIRFYLLRERTEGVFHPDHVNAFISQLRSTIAYAKLASGDTIPTVGDAIRQDQPPTTWGSPPMPPKNQPPAPPVPPPQNGGATVATFRELPVILPSSLSIAVLKVPVPMSESDFKAIVDTINSLKAVLVKP